MTLRVVPLGVAVRLEIEGREGTLFQPAPPDGPMGVPSVPTYVAGS